MYVHIYEFGTRFYIDKCLDIFIQSLSTTEENTLEGSTVIQNLCFITTHVHCTE